MKKDKYFYSRKLDVCRKESSRYCLHRSRHRYGIIVQSASIVEFFKLHLDSNIEFACLFLLLLALVHENLELHATNYATLMKLTMITWQFPGDCSRIAYTWSGNSYWISSRINCHNIHAYLLTARSRFLAFQITIALISCKKENKASLTECNWQLIRCLWKCMLDAGNRSSIKVSVVNKSEICIPRSQPPGAADVRASTLFGLSRNCWGGVCDES